ncbi:hypothetical protein QRX60_34670 [Amycolatopsis mongoliensis]|uniref:Uncharacterized protein n=1 Tax=Amycolatopsis mongoliensis TaxID=715475 RepID=A0A9Y2JKV5_9PSEU|nr:hypothetical protein [Amycolatopsis sp. 4-36]WIX99168.1 hypothetical protein QRX60_34670 [Amycolatopsis sp. 4-36]
MGVSEPRRIVVEIGDLVLDGFPPEIRRDVVAAAFRRELTRLLTGPVGFAASRSLDSAVASVAAPPSSRRLGEELARTVYATLDGAR